MKVSCFMLAPYAEITPEGKVYILSGDIDTFLVPTQSFPVTAGLPMYLAGKFTFPEEESGRNYPSTLEVVAPDGTILQTDHRTVDVPRPAPGRQTKVGFMVAFAHMTFPSPGTYTIRLRLEGLEGQNEQILFLYVDQVPEQRPQQ